MTTTTASPTQARDDAVAAWTEADAAMRKAQEAERSAPKPSAARATARAARLSYGAKKANRKHDIRQAELDLRIEGVEFTPWDEPAKPASASRLLPMTQAEIEEKLERVRKLRATLKPGDSDAVIHDCDVRIKALLKSAEQRGYEVA